jgi:hypothetical protein
MILFERFIARAGVDLPIFFEARGITSDEELRKYCSERGITPPAASYFESPVVPVPIPTDAVASKPIISTKKEPAKRTATEKTTAKDPKPKRKTTRGRKTTKIKT